MGLHEDIIQWIPYLIRYSDLDITGQICLKFIMPMQKNVMFVQEVVGSCQKKRDLYNLLLFKSHSKNGGYMLLGKSI